METLTAKSIPRRKTIKGGRFTCVFCLSTGGEELQSFAIGGGTGLFVGLILGIRKNRQVIRKADGILKDLREIDNLQKGE